MKWKDGQEASWVVNQLPDCAGFEPACGTRPLLPITQFNGPSKNSMDKKCRGLETGWQASNLRLPSLRWGVLSPLNYIRVRFRFSAIIHNERPIENCE